MGFLMIGIDIEDRKNMIMEISYYPKIDFFELHMGKPKLLFFWKEDAPLTRLDKWTTEKYEFRNKIVQEAEKRKDLFNGSTVEIVYLKGRNVRNEK